MRITDWLLGTKPEALKLADTTVRHIIPKVPVLDTTTASLTGYAKKSELVYACIEKKAQSACDPELIVQRKTKGGEWEKIDGHPALETLLEPNPWDDGESFMRTWFASENISGTFYAEIVKSRAGIPVQLYPLRPDCIFPQYRHTSQGDVLDYYSYFIDGFEIKYKPEELLIRRRHGLGSLYSGTSPLSVALGAVDADIAATEYVRAFFNNGGTPSGIITVKGRKMSKEEMEALQQKWVNRYSRGGKMRGGPAVLDEDAAYQPTGSNLDELNSESLTSIDETRICMAFGVPPVIIGAFVGLKNVNQKASFKGAMEEFWMNTMSPELKSIRKFLTRKYLPFFEDPEAIKREEIRFFWDMQNVQALQEDIDSVFDRMALGYKSGFVKLNEARSKVGLDEVTPEEGGEEFYKAPAPIDPNAEPTDGNKPKTRQEILDAKLADLTKGRADILESDTLEKKTFDFEGLTLSREPTELESKLDLKKAVTDQEEAAQRLIRVLMSLRSQLIESAGKEAAKEITQDLAELVLTPPANVYKQVQKILESAFVNGQNQLLDDIRKQGVEIAADIQAIIDSERVQAITDATVARVVNEVQTRAINQISTLRVLGEAVTSVAITAALEDQSTAWVDSYSHGAVNAATQAGRAEEMDANGDSIKKYEYSAILDAALCWFCKQWDGEQSEFLEGLPSVPNATCEGRDRCRCRIIAIVEA